MKYCVRLNSGGFYNLDYPHIDVVLKLWEEISEIFNNYPLLSYALGQPTRIGYKVTLDATDVIDYFTKRIFKVDLEDYYSESPDFYLYVDIKALNDGAAEGATGINLTNKFLQDLFIAMNLSFPTSFDLWFGEIYEILESYHFLANTPFYTSTPLQHTLDINSTWVYPQIDVVDFAKSWSWINKVGIPGVGVAKNVGQKVGFILLNLCSNPDFIIENSLAMSRGFEVILSDASQGISKNMKERIELLLGVPEENKKWFTQFYQLRSRVIHGELPVTRNSREYSFQNEEFLLEYEKPYYEAFSVFISLIQKMILTNCNGYIFSQNINPIFNT